MKFLNVIKHNVIEVKLDTRLKKKIKLFVWIITYSFLKSTLIRMKKGLINYTSFTIAL